MTHDEMIAVIAAHKDGKDIQYRPHGRELWDDCAFSGPAWEFNKTDYRIKPEPREPRVIWVNEYRDIMSAWPTKKDADFAAGRSRIRCFKAIEVIEDEK